MFCLKKGGRRIASNLLQVSCLLLLVLDVSAQDICGHDSSIDVNSRQIVEVQAVNTSGAPVPGVKVARSSSSCGTACPARPITVFTDETGYGDIRTDPNGAYLFTFQKADYRIVSFRYRRSIAFNKYILEAKVTPCSDYQDRHRSDTTAPFYKIDYPELLRVIQLFNYGEYHCDATTEDGYATGPGNKNCAPHSSDYVGGGNWRISIDELLRAIQLFNVDNGYYHIDLTTEDGFAPGR